MDYAKNLAENISNLRKQANLTQEALGEKLGLTFQAVSKWENGLCCPDVLLLPELAAVFGVTLDELFGVSKPCNAELPWANDDGFYAAVFQGHQLLQKQTDIRRDFQFNYEGEVGAVVAYANLSCGHVHGSVTASGGVNCANVNGYVQAGGGVNCAGIDGGVNAGGSVNCAKITGNVKIGGNINCKAIEGDARAGGDLECDTVSGNASAGGDLSAGHIMGNAQCNGDIHYK